MASTGYCQWPLFLLHQPEVPLPCSLAPVWHAISVLVGPGGNSGSDAHSASSRNWQREDDSEEKSSNLNGHSLGPAPPVGVRLLPVGGAPVGCQWIRRRQPEPPGPTRRRRALSLRLLHSRTCIP